jgi:hypothetical protein
VVPQTGPAQQMPWLHDSPTPQAWPQDPQFAGLVEVSTQTPEQLARPVVQHLPRVQVWLAVQNVAQVPQCRSSVWRSTHRGLAPAQKVAPAPQLHAALVHVPRPHFTPQAPQFISSDERSTQVPEQFTVPVGQHLPALHVWPPAQVVSHAPQFAGSVSVFTHAPAQLVRPAPQHRPALHVSPGAQAVAQSPQCCSSAWRSTHCGSAPTQRVVPRLH